MTNHTIEQMLDLINDRNFDGIWENQILQGTSVSMSYLAEWFEFDESHEPLTYDQIVDAVAEIQGMEY